MSRSSHSTARPKSPSPAWKLFRVTITWGPHTAVSEVSARSTAHARYLSYQDFSDAWSCTFREFLPLVKVERISAAADDGYGYVRRAYGVDPRIGQRVELLNEGDWTGRQGEIVHPGKSTTASIHVAFDGIGHALLVHPNNYRAIEGAAA